jgi:hypothetical protein
MLPECAKNCVLDGLPLLKYNTPTRKGSRGKQKRLYYAGLPLYPYLPLLKPISYKKNNIMLNEQNFANSIISLPSTHIHQIVGVSRGIEAKAHSY